MHRHFKSLEYNDIKIQKKYIITNHKVLNTCDRMKIGKEIFKMTIKQSYFVESERIDVFIYNSRKKQGNKLKCNVPLFIIL